MNSVQCKKCGNITDNSNRFCPNCGNQLDQHPGNAATKKTNKKKMRKKEAAIVCAFIAFLIAIPLFFNSLSKSEQNRPTTDNEESISESEYRSSCIEIDYKDLCRYPDEHDGELVTVEVRINQILKDGKTYWQGYTNETGYGYFGNEYVLVDSRSNGSVRILEEDIIIVYGEYIGLVTMERALGSVKVELPCISVKYVEIIE